MDVLKTTDRMKSGEMLKARRNLKICYWLIGAGCVMLIVLMVMMFTTEEKISWGMLLGLLLGLASLSVSAYNNYRILHGKRPWGDF